MPKIALFESQTPDALQRWDLAKKAAKSFQVGVTSRETVEKIIGEACRHIFGDTVKGYVYWYIPSDQGYDLYYDSEVLCIFFDKKGCMENVSIGKYYYPHILEK